MNAPETTTKNIELRKELHAAEVALRDQRERVAALRRELPRDTSAEDYELEIWRDGKAEPTRLSELFVDVSKPLIIMHFMHGSTPRFPLLSSHPIGA